MQDLLKKHATKLRFGLVGGFNTALDFGLLFLLTYLGIPKITANICSTTTAFLFSFALNKNFTFRSTGGDLKRQLVLFTVITLFGLWVIQSIIITLVTPAIVTFGAPESMNLLVAKLIATVASLIWNYIFYARVVFKTT